jgi:hypothetical protein
MLLSASMSSLRYADSTALHAPLTVKAARPMLTHLGAIRDHVQRHHV